MKAPQWIFFGVVVLIVLLILLGFFYVVRVDYNAEQRRMAEALRVRELELTAEGFSKEPNLLQERIEALEKTLRAHREHTLGLHQLMSKQQEVFHERLKQQEKRIEALERANKAGLFCGTRPGGQVWQDGR